MIDRMCTIILILYMKNLRPKVVCNLSKIDLNSYWLNCWLQFPKRINETFCIDFSRKKSQYSYNSLHFKCIFWNSFYIYYGTHLTRYFSPWNPLTHAALLIFGFFILSLVLTVETVSSIPSIHFPWKFSIHTPQL